MAITLNDLKKMSPRKKALLICLVFIVLGYFYWSLFLNSNIERRETLKVMLSELQLQVAEKERIAAKRDKYIREINVLKETFRMALTKLPTRKEMPQLLTAIAMAGKTAGIESILFEPMASLDKKPSNEKPSPPKPAEQKPGQESPPKVAEIDKFYEDIPIKITIQGSFHHTAVFFDKVAKLPRIINIEDISMGEGKDIKGSGRIITTSCVLKTYMFLEKPDGEKGKAVEKNK
jgi:type IV pilus assembly protein PilO